MDFGSKQCWIRPSKKSQNSEERPQINSSPLQVQPMFVPPQQPPQAMLQNRHHFQINQEEQDDNNMDTNIVTIGFDKLTEAEQKIQMGDPVFCKSCKAVLSKISKLEENKKVSEKAEQNKEKIEEQEESKDNNKEKQDAQKQEKIEEEELNGNMIWNCEFCSTKNVLNIEIEEIPQLEEVIYMVQSANLRNAEDNNQNLEEEQTVVFVIDVSGSMSVTAPIKNKDINTFKHSTMVSTEEFEMLKQFMDEEDIYQYSQMQSQQNFISRKQCVLAAIQQQLEDLATNQPNRKVGLIIFNNEVTIYGAGTSEPVVIAGDKLYRAEEVFEIGSNCSKQLFSSPVKQSKNRLIEIFNSIKEKGQTALGPAIVAALGVLSQQKKGSQIIVCTDGLANVGVGSFEEDKTSYVDFYEDIKSKAAENDAIFNIISIKGEGCKLDILGGIADKTGGNVLRVDPDNLHKDFANILQDEVVALKAEMTIFLKNLMKFRNTDPDTDKVSDNSSKCVKFIGNATKKTVATFEYTNKTDEEIIEQKLQDYDNSIKELPFQCQIFYSNLQGHKMLRVLTRNQEVTFDKKEAEKSLNYQVINTRITTHTAQLIQNNNFSKARTFNKGWESYVSMNDEVEHGSRQDFLARNAQLKNVARKKQNTHKAYQQQSSGNNRSSTAVNYQQPPQLSLHGSQHPPQSQGLFQPMQFAQSSFNSSAQFGGQIKEEDERLFETSHFGKQNVPDGCEKKEEKISVEKPMIVQNALSSIQEDCNQRLEAEEEMFSGDDDEAEDDEVEAYMYQQKNNKF